MLRRIPVDVDHPVPGGQTNTYLVGDPGVLVDPAGGLDALQVDPEAIDHLAVTHTHPDHTVGVEQVAAETDSTIWAFGPRAGRFTDRTGIVPDRTFHGGTEIGSTGVTVIELPGHAPDHVGFECASEMLVGDLARADGSVMVGDVDGDMRAYLSSLRRLIHADIHVAHPGHGPPIANPTERFSELLAHRLARESRVLDAVRHGAERPEAIVAEAYTKDLTGVEAAAIQTVRAHLAKLAVEGRVAWDGSTARIR